MFFQTLAVLLAVTLVAGQSTDAVCMSKWSWMTNSRGQNPCLVSSYIIGVCEGAINVPALIASDYYYVGPWRNEDNYCMCSTVTYSLMSACGICQNGQFLKWSDWSYNCTKDYPQEFTGDIPSGTSIPAWAYLDVLNQNEFNPVRAQQAAGLPESSAIATTPATSASSTRTSLSAATTTSAGAYPKKKSNIGPIIGGIVGGLVGLALIIAFSVTMIYYIRRRKQRAHTAPSTYATGYLNSPQTGIPFQYDPNRISHVPSMASKKPYDPTDPSTFPTTPLTPNSVYTTEPPVPMLGYAGHNGRNATPML